MKNQKLAIVLIISLLTPNLFAQSSASTGDFGKYFDECKLKGSFVLYDLNKNHYTFYNKNDYEVATSPASTFKIPNSMIALELGIIKDEKELLKWDGQKRWIDAWNADSDLENAFKNSTVWFYQELARRIGATNYRKYLKYCNYGNQNYKGKIDEFWLNDSLKISPKNQIEFLVKLYKDKLPCSRRTTDIFKRIMITEKTADYTISAKTGWYRNDGDDRDIGWWVGYVEKGSDVYFFATRVRKSRTVENDNFFNCRKEITKKILHELGVL